MPKLRDVSWMLANCEIGMDLTNSNFIDFARCASRINAGYMFGGAHFSGGERILSFNTFDTTVPSAEGNGI